MVTVEEVSVEEFRTLRAEWNRWLAESGSDTPFLRHEWLCALVDTLVVKPQQRPLILRLCWHGQTVGYAPLMQLRSRLRGVVPVWRLHFLGAQLTEFADLVTAERDPEVVRAFFHLLRRWRWMEFVGHYIGQDSPRLASYKELVRTWRGAQIEPYEPCWYIPIAGRSWGEYVQEEAGREFVVRGVRRRKALYEQVEWGIKQLQTLSPSDVDMVVRLHALSQRRKGRSSLFANHGAYRMFLERILAETSCLGWLRLFVLRIAQRWAAFILGFVYRDVFYWWLQGFDPAYERFAPTKVLLWHVLQRAFHEQCWREFNFMGGDTEYKRHWAKQHRLFYRLRLPNWSSPLQWFRTWWRQT